MPGDGQSGQTQSGAGANIKVLTDLVPQFDGQGDVLEWLSKLELIAELREVDRLEKVIPLFLTGEAHNMYIEWSADVRKSEKAVKEKLIKAFGMNRYKAYELFVRRMWRNEPVEVFATDLKRLARLGRVSSDELVRTQFIVGLPSAVSKALRATAKADEMELPDLVERARELLSELEVVDKPVAAPALGGVPHAEVTFGVGSGSAAKVPDGGSSARGGRTLRCFRCGGPHMKRHCPVKPKFDCWTCGQEGHSARDCSQGNGRGGAAAQVAAAPQNTD